MISDDEEIAATTEVTATGVFRRAPEFDALTEEMARMAHEHGAMRINLPGPIPFAPKHLFLNDIEYVRVDPEEEEDTTDEGGSDGV